MYVWQFQIGLNITIMGRTWDEFLQLCNILSSYCEDDEYFVVYVHNLSYEFQFLAGIYNFQKEEVFAVESRKVLKCDMFQHIEMRCAYLHSNMSLAEFTNKMDVEHKKLSGEDFDYSVVRYPWTPLTKKEINYCVNDVLGLVECIAKEFEIDNDNLYTIPLTSTGYVRRDVKRALHIIPKSYIAGLQPDINVYTLLREMFRGGNTHANRFHVGKILEDVFSDDMSSAYPYAICNCEFPVKPFAYYGDCTSEELRNYIHVRKKAAIMRCRCFGARLKNPFWGCPYIPRDKARHIVNGVYDNGRILQADYFEISINDIDLQIILSEYDFEDLQFFDVYLSSYGKLPKPFIEVVIDYFVKKTELKGVPGMEQYYMKSKNKLNANYGMMAQDPIKQSIEYINGEFVERSDDIEELLDESTRKAFLCYQWGVWVTSWVRFRLEEGIQKCGDNFVYCDTDSVKHIGKVDFKAFNKQRMKESIANGSFATDPKGITHYMGVFEDDGHYSKFATLGAKKYCYQLPGETKTHCTIAGVNKKKGGEELDKQGGITAFKPGFIFRDAGGTESVYNDNPEIKEIFVDGRSLPITRNVAIMDSEYTLGITAEYEKLLEDSKIFLTLCGR